ncbi:uncharacterized protein FOMMEDRAFT_159573 [Fomitiporia mediterranea MF3/22]|uniref:uncharacterized protein n=1 Tax=Fomitiporia mediterranea (strain MF3/22) TaxID=694068 RepID=UPI0004407C33|nr:uncharacterized protein FOMMEDRAFT_159573 [Fomitiporia mediterranea MF3/22]EJC99993.1 hypothetical protein FOMMEDRAFT_159573 [Fomitiporia mediterranea MF3/22]
MNTEFLENVSQTEIPDKLPKLSKGEHIFDKYVYGLRVKKSDWRRICKELNLDWAKDPYKAEVTALQWAIRKADMEFTTVKLMLEYKFPYFVRTLEVIPFANSNERRCDERIFFSAKQITRICEVLNITRKPKWYEQHRDYDQNDDNDSSDSGEEGMPVCGGEEDENIAYLSLPHPWESFLQV